MHQALAIPELLFHILRLDPDIKKATVNRLWSEVCLDVCWESIEDIFLIFGVLAPLSYENNDVVWKTLPAKNRWERLCFYTNRMRHVSVSLPLGWNKGSTIWRLFLSLRPGNIDLFPNLQSIFFKASDREAIAYLPIFVGPNTVDFSLLILDFPLAQTPYPDFETQIDLMFTILANQCPLLERLTFKSWFSVTQGVSETLAKGLSRLESLSYVDLNLTNFTIEIIDSLSLLPRLTDLKIGIPNAQDEDGEMASQHYGMPYITSLAGLSRSLESGCLFPSLRSLRIPLTTPGAVPLWDVALFLGNQLLQLCVDSFDTGCREKDIRSALSFVAKNCSVLNNLSLFSFHDSERFEDDTSSDEELQATLATFRPLFSSPIASQLVSLDIGLEYAPNLSYDDINVIARALPRIERLMFSAMALLDYKERGLAALLPLAEHCHYLRELRIDTTWNYDVDKIQKLPVVSPFCSLQVLHSTNSYGMQFKEMDIVPVATFLRHLCPKARFNVVLRDDETWNRVLKEMDRIELGTEG